MKLTELGQARLGAWSCLSPKAALLRPKTPSAWAGHRDPDSARAAS